MKEKTADELFEELGYEKKNLDIILSRFWEEWGNQDLAKTLHLIITTKLFILQMRMDVELQ